MSHHHTPVSGHRGSLKRKVGPLVDLLFLIHTPLESLGAWEFVICMLWITAFPTCTLSSRVFPKSLRKKHWSMGIICLFHWTHPNTSLFSGNALASPLFWLCNYHLIYQTPVAFLVLMCLRKDLILAWISFASCCSHFFIVPPLCFPLNLGLQSFLVFMWIYFIFLLLVSVCHWPKSREPVKGSGHR